MPYHPGKRKEINGEIKYVPVSQLNLEAKVRVDDDGNKVHGNYATLYLKERPRRTNNPETDIQVSFADGGSLSYRSYPVAGSLGVNEFTLDYDTSIVFLHSSHDGKKFNVAYQGSGGVVDWEKIVDERIIRHVDGGFASSNFVGESDVDGGSAQSVTGVEDLVDGGAAHNDMPIYEKIRIRRDRYDILEDIDPRLAQGEPVFDLTNERLKIGIGEQWASTPYLDCRLGTFDFWKKYNKNDLVAYSGKIYKSLADNNLGRPPQESPSFWEEYIPNTVVRQGGFVGPYNEITLQSGINLFTLGAKDRAGFFEINIFVRGTGAIVSTFAGFKFQGVFNSYYNQGREQWLVELDYHKTKFGEDSDIECFLLGQFGGDNIFIKITDTLVNRYLDWKAYFIKYI